MLAAPIFEDPRGSAHSNFYRGIADVSQEVGRGKMDIPTFGKFNKVCRDVEHCKLYWEMA